VIGHVLLYNPASDCENLKMTRLLSDVLLIQYLRLIQMIMIAVLIIVCCPLIYFCGLFRRNRQVAADKVTISYSTRFVANFEESKEVKFR